MEVVDGSTHRNTYQTKRGVSGETRMAIVRVDASPAHADRLQTTHADADLGVCFKNVAEGNPSDADLAKLGKGALEAAYAWLTRAAVDLDVDIGADAVE